MIETTPKVNEIQSFYEGAAEKLAPKKADGKDNINQVFGEHWSTAEKTKFAEQGRIPVDQPILYPKALAVLGYELANRETFEGEPQGKEDELVVQVINACFRDIENNPNPKKYEHTKSDVFKDGIIACFGASEIYVETDELGYPEVKIRHIPYDQIVFDPNFYDVEGTQMSRIQHAYDAYVDDLEREYPDKKEQLKQIPEDLLAIEDRVNPMQDIADGTTAKKKICKKIRDWKKVNTVVYRIFGTGSEVIEEWGTKEEAQTRIQELAAEKLAEAKKEHDAGVEEANLDAQTFGQPVQEPPAFDMTAEQIAEDMVIKEVPKAVWEYSVIAGNVLLEGPQVMDVDDECPITLYFSLFMDGQFYTPITVGKKLQKYADRLFAQADYSIGIDAKGGVAIDLNSVDETANSPDEVIDAYTRGRPIFVRGQNAITPIQRGGGYPHFTPMFELLLKMNEDMFGGRTFQGAVDYSGQSGKAIQRLQAQANLMALQYMDNLRRYDLQVGRKVLKYIQHYYTHEFTIKVMGDTLTEEIKQAMAERGVYEESDLYKGFGFVYGNREHSMLAKANLTININKVSARQDEKDVLFEKYVQLMQMGYPVPPEAFIHTLDLPATQAQAIIKAYEEQQKQQEQARQMEIAQGIIDTNLKQQDNLVNAGNLLQQARPEQPEVTQ